jgi:hypothetical protein
VCSYEVDVGCGPDLFEATCRCVDASYAFDHSNLPLLCDCRAITTRALCQRYAQDCSWSEQRAACEESE